jgi:hypothetical protein
MGVMKIHSSVLTQSKGTVYNRKHKNAIQFNPPLLP